MVNFWQHFTIDHMVAQAQGNILQVKLKGGKKEPSLYMA